MATIKVIEIAGARPNFMKVAPVHRELLRKGTFEPILVHTGQHYDDAMSKVFFTDLRMPEPDMYLGVGSGTHAYQTARVMAKLEPVLQQTTPELVVVVGDVNSTLAAAITAAKLTIPVAHIEAGLRSFNLRMPEEINRTLTDALSSFLFATEESGVRNLRKEGIAEDKIHFVGNVMIDSLVEFRPVAMQSKVVEALGLQPQAYALLTLHRPSNVDEFDAFDNILQALEKIQWEIPVIFPVHPRTRKQIDRIDVADRIARMPYLIVIEPLGYIDFLKLMMDTKFVMTDSGGIQEETAFLGIPCLTLREETERPVTVELGENIIVGSDRDRMVSEARRIIDSNCSEGGVPPLWDGHAARRIVAILERELSLPQGEGGMK